MKKARYLFYFISSLLMFASCVKNNEFNPNLLPGKWQQGTLFEYYNADGNGHTWDEADDVTEEEALPFTWTLDKERLTQIHLMENGVTIPKRYTVTELTSGSLKYHDDFNKNYSFIRVE